MLVPQVVAMKPARTLIPRGSAYAQGNEVMSRSPPSSCDAGRDAEALRAKLVTRNEIQSGLSRHRPCWRFAWAYCAPLPLPSLGRPVRKDLAARVLHAAFDAATLLWLSLGGRHSCRQPGIGCRERSRAQCDSGPQCSRPFAGSELSARRDMTFQSPCSFPLIGLDARSICCHSSMTARTRGACLAAQGIVMIVLLAAAEQTNPAP